MHYCHFLIFNCISFSNVHIIVSYGVSISTVASNLMESVKYRVEEFTSLEVERINIYVEGVKDIG